MSALSIRSAREADLPRLTEIYNHYVLHTPFTFDILPLTGDDRKPWLAQFQAGGRHRLLVAERDGVVEAYAGSHPFRSKAAYETTVETTVYCAHGATRGGLGGHLYAALFAALSGEDIHSFIAGITLPNEASVRLHERCGFTLSGVMHGVGRKFGSYWDVAWYERVS